MSRNERRLQRRLGKERAKIADAEARIARVQREMDAHNEELAELLAGQDPGLMASFRFLLDAAAQAVEEQRTAPVARGEDGALLLPADVPKDAVEAIRLGLVNVIRAEVERSGIAQQALAGTSGEERERVLSVASRALARRGVRWAGEAATVPPAPASRPLGTADRLAAAGLLDAGDELPPRLQMRVALLTDAERLRRCLRQLERRGKVDPAWAEACALRELVGKFNEALGRLASLGKRVEDTFASMPRIDVQAQQRLLDSAAGIMRQTESMLATARELLELPPETDAEVAAVFKAVRTTALGSADGLLVQAGQVAEQMRAGDVSIEELRAANAVGFRRAFSGLCATWADADLMQLGVLLWNDTYRQLATSAGDDVELAQHVISRHIGDLYAPATPTKRQAAVDTAQFAALWAHDAFQKVVTTHTYAAALMCSDAQREALGDLHLPWRAFMVVVPDGMLQVVDSYGDARHYRRALVCVLAEGEAILCVYDPDAQPVEGRSTSAMLLHVAPSLADLLFDPPEQLLGLQGPLGSSAEARVLRMVTRMVTGLLVALLYTNDFRKPKAPKGAQRGGGRDPHRAPEHRVTFVGKPLKIDCRAQVASYLAGKPGSRRDPKAPAVQFMVRGHHKRQVIGVGRTGRKVIWVEPYWKGAEDAPILTKPKLVTP